MRIERISKYKGLELYVSENIKDLSYMLMRIERSWAICFNDIKDLSYMFGELKGLELYVLII